MICAEFAKKHITKPEALRAVGELIDVEVKYDTGLFTDRVMHKLRLERALSGENEDFLKEVIREGTDDEI
jgi:hypothetical protein